MHTAAAAKGRGLGQWLVTHLEVTAREMGYRGLYLETHTNLTAALALYEKLGYRQIERPGSVVTWDDESVFCEGMVGHGACVTVAE